MFLHQVTKNQEFLLLPATELERLLSSDNLNVPSEEIIFQVPLFLQVFVVNICSCSR